MSDLQPLAKKDGPTLASALIAALQPVLEAARSGLASSGGKRVKVVHMLVGEGVNTNESATNKLLHHCSIDQAAGAEILGGIGLVFGLVVIKLTWGFQSNRR